MPLNYSKWDALELSDDSDIEGHPNVDKRSLIRWKQRDIHEKREQRKHHIAALRAEIACNLVLLPRLHSILSSLPSQGPPYFSSLVDRLKSNPSPDAPKTDAPNQVPYDTMIYALLVKVYEEVKEQGVDKDSPELGAKLAEALARHVQRLGEDTERLEKELEKEEEEQKKKITSEDLHEGFDSKYVPAAPEPAPIKGAHVPKPTTSIEVLNPASSSSPTPAPDEAEDDDLPELTPTLTSFSHLPLRAYDRSFAFIQQHRDVIVPGASDALLVAAFTAQSEGKAAYAKQCVHQSLLVQYCEKLGGDGVRVFFQKMIAGDKKAVPVFLQDVENTYAHLVQRVEATAAEASQTSGELEQIQLVPENPTQSISFYVPDGPPPPNLSLSGPNTEHMDVEEVRKALQMRWDVFEGFSEELKDALRGGTLEGVNRVLGEMRVEEAEGVVRLLDVAGILNFSEGGVRDETGRGEEEGEEGEGEEGEGEEGEGE